MADRSDLAPSAMANLLIFCGSTPEKQRTLLITMIQEIQRPVKCQKLNKFTSRNRKLSVKQAKDQSLACSGLFRPLRSNVVGNRTVPYLAGSVKVFRGLPRSCPPPGAVPPHKRPVAYGHKPAYAGRCGGNSASLKCGREPDGSLPGRFHLGFLGNGFCFPQKVSGVPYLPGI